MIPSPVFGAGSIVKIKGNGHFCKVNKSASLVIIIRQSMDAYVALVKSIGGITELFRPGFSKT